MNDAKGNEFYQMGDKWFRDRKTPGYGSTTMPNAYDNPNAAEWLGAQFAADSRFAEGAVDFWYKALFQRELLQRYWIRPDPIPLPAWLLTTHSRKSSTRLLRASRPTGTRSRTCWLT